MMLENEWIKGAWIDVSSIPQEVKYTDLEGEQPLIDVVDEATASAAAAEESVVRQYEILGCQSETVKSDREKRYFRRALANVNFLYTCCNVAMFVDTERTYLDRFWTLFESFCAFHTIDSRT